MEVQDELIMQILHYFITKKNYNPIILHGIKNEIWLENMDQKYRVVRIISNHIHNNEQLDFDVFKTKRISRQIKNKTLTLNLDNVTNSHMRFLNINEMKDFKNYKDVLELYPSIDKEVKNLEGMDLFMKLTSDITKKTEKDAIENEKIFSMKSPIMTYLLIAINVIVFLLMYVLGNGSTDVATLAKFGANNSVAVATYHEYYRLFTSIFLHIGFIHLACNMYALYVIGPQIESFYGKAKFLIIYLLGGVIGNLFANIFEVNTIGAGASGAIFALFGAMLYFGYHYRVYLGRTQILPVIVLNLLIGFTSSGISNAAHIGGLIGGTLLSYALGVPKKSKASDSIHGTILSILLIVFLVYMSIFR